MPEQRLAEPQLNEATGEVGADFDAYFESLVTSSQRAIAEQPDLNARFEDLPLRESFGSWREFDRVSSSD